MKRTFGLFGLSIMDSNKGSEALTYTFLSMLQRFYPSDDLHIISFMSNNQIGEIQNYFPSMTFTCHHLIKINPYSWYKAYKEVKKCDCIFDASAGDGFTGIYGAARNFVQALRKQLPVWAHKPYYLLPQTYGSYKFPFIKWSIGLIQKAKLAYARDEETAKEVGPFVKVTSDLAFGLPYDKYNYQLGNKKKFGVNVSSLLWDDITRARFDLSVDYKGFHIELIDFLINGTDYEVHLIPHVVNIENFEALENDYRICSILKKKFGDAVVLAPLFKTPIEAKSYISNMDFFIGSRMHATIGAISSGVTTIPFSYAYKFEALYSNLDYPFIISARRMSTKEALSVVKTWITNPTPLIEAGSRAVNKAKGDLKNFEEDLKESLVNEGLL